MAARRVLEPLLTLTSVDDPRHGVAETPPRADHPKRRRLARGALADGVEEALISSLIAVCTILNRFIERHSRALTRRLFRCVRFLPIPSVFLGLGAASTITEGAAATSRTREMCRGPSASSMEKAG